ncbi:MAG: hydrogenase maturation protease [Phycisphaerae bacterium]|jgi:hydrogenase maturation protease|nr:hydrogenase maturation protease [Phycisphaerae bacterium]
MIRRDEAILILALGNDIIGDDGVALAAARALRETFAGDLNVDVVESAESGLALIDLLSPYDRVLLLDSIEAGDLPAGTVQEFSRDDFHRVLGPSPHYAGLPEVIALADKLGIDFPSELRVLAIKIDFQEEFHQGLSDDILQALPDYINQAEQILRNWVRQHARNITN